MNVQMEVIRNTPCPYGTATIWWLGQMGLMIKMGETLMCVDYYASESPKRQVAPPIPADELSGVDIFLGTHDHSDHIDHPAWRIWARQCPESVFVFPAAHQQRVLEDGVAKEKCRPINDGEEIHIGEVKVTAIAAAHEFLNQDSQTGYYPALQYILEGNGVRIYHAGDTLRYEGMVGKLKALGRMDAALVPINGRDAERYLRNCIGNMTYQEAVDLVGEIKPGLVIPGHWDMFARNPGDPNAFAAYLDAKYPGLVPCRIPGYLEPILVKG